MKNKITVTHYRYKSSDVYLLWKLAKDYNINPDKLIKERNPLGVACYQVSEIQADDVFPKGGFTCVSDENGGYAETECSLNDNYEKKRGVRMCIGRMAKNHVPF